MISKMEIRSIREIKREICDAFVSHPDIIKAYGLRPGKTFEEQFSKVSLESILFYVVASSMWLMESMMHKHRDEVVELVESLKPHRLRWYSHMARLYMHGHQLIRDTDRYDLSGLSNEQIAEARVVRYAVSTESSTIVYIKVAGADGAGRPAPLSAREFAGFKAYVDEIKDAGVAIEVINQPPDSIRLNLELFVSASFLGNHAVANQTVSSVIQGVLNSFPFDGILRLSDIVRALEALSDVEVAVIRAAEVKTYHALEWTNVDGYCRPYAGYWSLDGLGVNYRLYNKYD